MRSQRTTYEEEGQEEEDLASTKATFDLFYPSIIVCHPSRAAFNRDVGWLCHIPVEFSLLVLPSKAEHVEELGQDRSSRRAKDVVLTIQEQDDRSSHKQDSRKQKCQPKSNELLYVDHRDLSGQGANVDAKVKIQKLSCAQLAEFFRQMGVI